MQIGSSIGHFARHKPESPDDSFARIFIMRFAVGSLCKAGVSIKIIRSLGAKDVYIYYLLVHLNTRVCTHTEALDSI